MDKRLKKLLLKTVIFIISISVAWWMIESGILHTLVDTISPIKYAAEFLAGAFYTSFLTIPIALAMLAVLAQDQNPIVLAAIAGLGSTLADFILVKIIRDNFSDDIYFLTKHFKVYLFKKILKFLKLDFIIPVIGAIIIASPLPDELGLVLLGVSKLKNYQIIILTYILNTAGILIIVTPINLLS